MKVHKVKTARKTEDLMQKLTTATHRGQSNYACEDCCLDQMLKGCENPHKYAAAAKCVLDQLIKKWDP